MKTELFLPDPHIPDINDIAFLTMLEWVEPRQIDILTLGGDICDFDSLSNFIHNPNGPTLGHELHKFKEFLLFLDDVLGYPEEKYYILGNHERRLLSYLWSKAPRLSELKSLAIPHVLGLEDFGYTFIDNKKIMEDGNPPFDIGGLYHLHGDEMNVGAGAVNVARLALRRTHENVIFGHFHRSDEAYEKDLKGDVIGAWAVGTLGPLSKPFAAVNNWNHGFAVISYFDDGYFTVENKKIIDGRVV